MAATELPETAHRDGLESVKVPPHSIEAEQAVLGGLMLDNATWDQIADRVSEPDFYRNEHRKIFAAIAALAERSDPFDAGDARVLVTVGSEEQVAGPEKPPEIDGEADAAMLGEPHMVDYASGFARSLRKRGVDCRFELIEGETHTSVIPPAMARALRFCRDEALA